MYLLLLKTDLIPDPSRQRPKEIPRGKYKFLSCNPQGSPVQGRVRSEGELIFQHHLLGFHEQQGLSDQDRVGPELPELGHKAHTCINP